MVMKPTPTTYSCPACGWKKTVAPTSDVRLRNVDSFDRCPKCGNEYLNRQPVGAIGGLVAQIEEALHRQYCINKQNER